LFFSTLFVSCVSGPSASQVDRHIVEDDIHRSHTSEHLGGLNVTIVEGNRGQIRVNNERIKEAIKALLRAAISYQQ